MQHIACPKRMILTVAIMLNDLFYDL